MRYRRTYLKLVRRQDDGEPAVVLPPEEIPNELGSTLSDEEWPEGQAPKRVKKTRSLTPDQKLVAALRGESDEGAYVDRDYITLWRSFLSSCPTYDRFEEVTTEHPNGLIIIQGVYARVSLRRTTEFGLSCALNVPMQVTSRRSGFTTTHSCLWIGFERRRDGVRRIDDYAARIYHDYPVFTHRH